MMYKTYTTNIQNFDFATAKFEELPFQVFQINPKTLSKEDRVILDAIKFQMMVSKANSVYQNINYNNITKSFSTGVMFAMLGFFVLSLTYYANVNLNLGMNFLTELFA